MTASRRARGGRIDERSFHRWLAANLWAGRHGILPLGDDAAALRLPPGALLLGTSDVLVEGVHFLPGTEPEAVGAAAASVNLSDIAAKGGRPIALLLDLLLPPGTPPGWPRAVARGAEATVARFGAHVVGGDTKPAPVPVVAATALGWVPTDALVRRSGARPGDLLVVTGTVGRGGAAYRELAKRGTTRSVRRRLVDVVPRVREGPALAPYADAMMDTSDGVADATHLMAEASGVRIIVAAERLPVTPRLGRPRTARDLDVAFFGGDYELLAAVPPGRLDPARRALLRFGCPLTVIGSIERGRGAQLERGGRREPLPRALWQPFAARPLNAGPRPSPRSARL
ncbi:MAG TPA: thiamine-phosphate kinase [Thermoplasmata archaeon]|nr:thiamine-phosphate kinase [Thermoplasmata archaeon]